MTTQQIDPVPDTATDADRPARLVLAGVMALSALILLLSLFYNLRGHWSVWKQGDWLINSINGPVRRGPFGSAIIHVADAVHLSPITVVVGIQVVLLLTLYLAWYVAVRGLPDARVALLLTCTPAMFLVIWPANAYDGSLRKELIAMAALALMLVHLRTRAAWPVLVAGALMAGGVWAHEIVLLFVPAFAYLAWRAWRQDQVPTWVRRVLVGVVVVVAVSGLFAGLYTLRHSDTTAIGPACQPLVERGLSRDAICTGPFRWLTLSSEHSMDLVEMRNLSGAGLARFAAVLAISLPALAYVVVLLERRRVAVLAVVAAVPMLPLFGLVIDWGRWLSCGVFAFAAVIVAELLTGRTGLRARPRVPLVVAAVALCFVLAPYHVNDVVPGGLVSKAYDVLRDAAASL